MDNLESAVKVGFPKLTYIFDRNKDDIEYHFVSDAASFKDCVVATLGSSPYQLVVTSNGPKRTLVHYRIVLSESPKSSAPCNILFANFLVHAGISSINPRCTVAVVACLEDPMDWNSFVDMPYSLAVALDPLGKLRDEGEGEGPAYRYTAACNMCAVDHVKCDHVRPCETCRSKNRPCISYPSGELRRRAYDLIQALKVWSLFKHDHILRLLHMQNSNYSKKALFQQIDIFSINARVKTLQERLRSLGVPEHPPTLGQIPQGLMDVAILLSPLSKQEWMDGAVYEVMCSPDYRKSIISECDILKLAVELGMPPVLVDTMRLRVPDAAYTLWVQSVRNCLEGSTEPVSMVTTMLLGFGESETLAKVEVVKKSVVYVNGVYTITVVRVVD